MPLFGFLLAAVGPLAKRVLLALGVGIVSYAAVSTLANTLIQSVQTAWGGVSGSILQVASMAGIPESLSIMSGAILARVSLVAVSKLGRVAG